MNQTENDKERGALTLDYTKHQELLVDHTVNRTDLCQVAGIETSSLTHIGERKDVPTRELPEHQKNRKPTVQERIQGCLYGGAAGDALGYPVEFMTLDQIRNQYGSEGIQCYKLDNGRAVFSDDTQMLLFTLEGIYLWRDMLKRNRDGKKLRNAFYEAYRDWYFTQMGDCSRKEQHQPRTQLYLFPSMHCRRGPGFTCIRALRSKRKGSMDTPCNDSKGNGGVMRVAPIGFALPQESMEDVMLLAAENAALTHGHPLGYISAAMMAGLIKECVYGESTTLRSAVQLALDAAIKMFSSIPATQELDLLITEAMKLAEEPGDALEHMAGFGSGACAESAMAIAVYCALRYENSFDQAIQTAVNIDGDSDTVAAVTGNILGAWNGICSIDQKWIEPLHLDEYLGFQKYYS